MPSIGVSRDEPRRPDIVIGDRYGTSCAALLPDVVEDTMSGLGYSVGRNKPYAGGFITEHYGNPASGLHTIQLELNRAIYMDERRRERSAGFAQVTADFAALADALAGCRSAISARSRPRRSRCLNSAVIPGRATGREPGIHYHDRALWIPGSRCARPGMTRDPKRKKGRLNEQAAQV